MKKLAPFLILLLVAVAIGLWIGLHYFKSDEQATFVSYSHQKKVTPAQSSKESTPEKSKVNAGLKPNERRSMESIWQEYDRLIAEIVFPTNKACMDELTNAFNEKDYLDPKDNNLYRKGAYDQAKYVLNAIVGKIQNILPLHELNLSLLYNKEVDPLKLKTKMAEGIVCSDVKITNFTNALIKDMARRKLSPEIKSEHTTYLLNISFQYIYSPTSVENTSAAMEVLFGLVDNEFLPRTRTEELSVMRQDLILLVQNYENDFRSENSPELNRQIMQDFYEDLNLFNSSLLELIERLKFELPKY